MTRNETAECDREQIYTSFCRSLQWRPVGLANYEMTQCELSWQPCSCIGIDIGIDKTFYNTRP